MFVAQRFELFRDDPLEPQLIASFDDLQAAKDTMESVALDTPGQYFIWIPSEGEIIAQLVSSTNSIQE